MQSSIGGDLDDFGALDLYNDDDFNDDFGMGIGATGHSAVQQPLPLTAQAQAQIGMAAATNAAAAFPGSYGSSSQELGAMSGDGGVASNANSGADPTLDKADPADTQRGNHS